MPTIGNELPSVPSPAAGLLTAAGETGFSADPVGFFSVRAVLRFGRGESGARGERALSLGRRLPVLFATRNHAFLAARTGVITGTGKQCTPRASLAPVLRLC